MITLGVADLARATKFYEAVLGTPPDTSNDGVTFFELPGVWLSLFPRDPVRELCKLAGLPKPPPDT